MRDPSGEANGKETAKGKKKRPGNPRRSWITLPMEDRPLIWPGEF
jgi:hypothetical protein